MFKKISIAISVFLLSANVNADTLSNLLNDIKDNMIVVEKSGSCDRNPNLTVANSETKILKPCPPVVAKCPVGTTIIPGISTCKRNRDTTDAEILGILKNIKGGTISDLSKPMGFDSVIKSKSSMKTNQQQCDIDADGWEWTNNDTNYSPFCFFDLSTVEYVSNANLKYAVKYDVDGALVTMQNKPGSYGYKYPETFESFNNYSKITASEFNNSNNYKCYAINIKATARCIAVPNGFVKKLGVSTDVYE